MVRIAKKTQRYPTAGVVDSQTVNPRRPRNVATMAARRSLTTNGASTRNLASRLFRAGGASNIPSGGWPAGGDWSATSSAELMSPAVWCSSPWAACYSG